VDVSSSSGRDRIFLFPERRVQTGLETTQDIEESFPESKVTETWSWSLIAVCSRGDVVVSPQSSSWRSVHSSKETTWSSYHRTACKVHSAVVSSYNNWMQVLVLSQTLIPQAVELAGYWITEHHRRMQTYVYQSPETDLNRRSKFFCGHYSRQD
jgi:hypothetical protein